MPDLIDVHAHDYPETYLAACRRRDSGMESYVRDDGRLVILQDKAVALAAPQPMPTIDERLAAMDEAGVGIQVLSISAPNVYRFPRNWRASLTQDLNDELVSMAPASDFRLRTLLSLPLPDVDAALAELERSISQPGVAGVMLTTTIDRRTLDDEAFVPLLEELSRRECLVLVHPTTACCTEGIRDYALALGIDYLAETTLCIARLVYSGVMSSYPGIRWVFAHLGGTLPFLLHRLDNYYQQFPECRAKIDKPPSEILRRIYLDTVSTHVPALRCALETFGAEQLLFGTDYPHVPGGMTRLREALAAALGDESELELIGRRSPERLLRRRDEGAESPVRGTGPLSEGDPG